MTKKIHELVEYAEEANELSNKQQRISNKDYTEIQNKINSFMNKPEIKKLIGDFDYDISNFNSSSNKFKGHYFACKVSEYIQKKLKGTPFRVVNGPVFIKGYENYEFDAIIINKNADGGIANHFKLKYVKAVLEYKINGIYFSRKNKGNTKANIVQTFAKYVALSKHLEKINPKIKYIYITAFETNPKTKKGEVYFFDITKKVFEEFGIKSFILCQKSGKKDTDPKSYEWKGVKESDTMDQYFSEFNR